MKNILPVYQVITNQQMVNASQTSPIISVISNVAYKDTIGYQFNFTGNPTGVFLIQDCLDYNPSVSQNSTESGAPNSGNWTSIPFATTPVAGGTGTSPVRATVYQTSAPYFRCAYYSTATGAQTIALVADSSGSLNSTYFLLSDEASTNKYYVWFNINSAGVDPAVAGRTGVEIDGATNASAATLGASVATAVAALNSSNSFTTSGTSTVTITNKTAGPFVPATDGAAPTGFTFATTVGNGVLNAFVSGKSLG